MCIVKTAFYISRLALICVMIGACSSGDGAPEQATRRDTQSLSPAYNGCRSAADCAPDQICEMTTAFTGQCVAAPADLQSATVRPAPPAGLLDGSALRGNR
ncbi:MAG: hypothetical protein D6761_00605 [Candidatus Dadabacteria bacterium]|nr:MAG: hypothetical protein D6761_00605 [Candidatus Dadabacteria bacterium]